MSWQCSAGFEFLGLDSIEYCSSQVVTTVRTSIWKNVSYSATQSEQNS